MIENFDCLNREHRYSIRSELLFRSYKLFILQLFVFLQRYFLCFSRLRSKCTMLMNALRNSTATQDTDAATRSCDAMMDRRAFSSKPSEGCEETHSGRGKLSSSIERLTAIKKRAALFDKLRNNHSRARAHGRTVYFATSQRSHVLS